MEYNYSTKENVNSFHTSHYIFTNNDRVLIFNDLCIGNQSQSSHHLLQPQPSPTILTNQSYFASFFFQIVPETKKPNHANLRENTHRQNNHT